MVTCKLEYMIKNLDLEAQKRLVFLFDKDSAFDFHPVYTKKIEEFKDLDSTCSSEYEEIMYQVIKEEADELCEKYPKDLKKYRKSNPLFTDVNYVCSRVSEYLWGYFITQKKEIPTCFHKYKKRKKGRAGN